MLRKSNGDASSQTESSEEEEEQWDGIAEPPAATTQEAEYADEDRFTTVTVEAVDISRDGFEKAGEDAGGESYDRKEVGDSGKGQYEYQTAASGGKRTWTKERPGGVKKKKKKFRYENKADRKITRYKERSHGRKQARERKS